jgi:Lysyl oxidase
MRRRLLLGLALAAMLVLSGTALAVSHIGDNDGTPDLIVDQKILQNHWIVRDERLPADACSVVEGGITPGDHRLLRFAVSTPNVGTADINLGDPNAHVAANDGLYEFATCHNHFHFRHYALYELIDPVTGHVWRAAKRGFCMIDVTPASQAYDGPQKTWTYRSCGAVSVPGNQGISVGWADEYWWFLGGQYFVLDGGDGQALIPPGTYIIRITVDPPFTSTGEPNDPCLHTDTLGYCHMLSESDYTNNVAEATITIPDHPGRSGWGPGTNDKEPKPEKGFSEVIDDEK